LTIPHNFTLDVKTERIYKEFQDLVRKDGSTVSKEVRKTITQYVELRSAKVVKPIKATILLEPKKMLMLPSPRGREMYHLLDKEQLRAYGFKYGINKVFDNHQAIKNHLSGYNPLKDAKKYNEDL